jgi:hypothetical protein
MGTVAAASASPAGATTGAAATTSAVTTVTIGAATTDTSRDAWRFVAQYRSLAACQDAGEELVAQHEAHAYRCENDYAEDRSLALDLYVR